jgi:transposase
MNKIDNELIKKINSYPVEDSDREIAKKLGISRKTVAKYREDLQQALSKEDKLKQELVKTYSADELRDLLTHLQTNTAKSVEKIIGDK